jgi:dUTP pyrophosphatase
MKLRFKKFRSDLKALRATGDWIDIRVADVLKNRKAVVLGDQYVNLDDSSMQEFAIKAGEDVFIRHGIALELPAGCEALVRPRGSLFAKTGLIFTSSGVIDEGFNGDHDEWFTTYRATRDVVLHLNDRVAQFRIFKKQPELDFEEVSNLYNQDRGGLGSTGGYHDQK